MISVYRLNADGSVPEYVIDGGYFPHAIEGLPAQAWDLVGITTQEAPGAPLPDAAALESHLVSIGGDAWTDPSGNPVDLAAQAAWLWSRQ